MNDIVSVDFDAMKISELREYAAHMRIPLAKTATKEEIKEAIKHKLAGRAAPVLAKQGDKVPPGHAKIIINEDPNPGSMQVPIYLNANGYVCTIPRGKEVIVPMRVVRVLQEAKVNRLVQKEVQDQYGRMVFQNTTVTVPSYPFQVLEVSPGPEPLTILEKQKMRSHGPRKRYAEMFGRYPRPAELRRAIEKGLIKLHDDETIEVPSPDMLEDEQEV